MQPSSYAARNSRVWLYVCLAAAILLAYRARTLLLPVVQVAAGGAALAFLLAPVSTWLERRFSPSAAALMALALAAAALSAFLWLLLPTITRQLYGFAEALPEALQALRGIAERLTSALRAHGLSLPDFGRLDLSPLGGRLMAVAQGALGAAHALSSGLSRFALMVVLCYFILADRERLLLRLELLVPSGIRCLAVEMGGAVTRELRQYLRAQATIAAIVGLLSSLGLLITGVPSSLLLGLTVGVLNMIPYLGPVLGAIPALLLALSRGPATVLWAGVALFAVQQLDGAVISPRVMGSLTGISPAVVLLTVFLGAQFAGVAGMLFALPVLISIRACLRVFMQRRLTEQAEKDCA